MESHGQRYSIMLSKPLCRLFTLRACGLCLLTENSLKCTSQCRIEDMLYTGGKPRNYHEIVLTQICSQATSGTRRGSFQAENWIKKGWCHVHFCFILQLRANNGEIRQCSSV